MAESYISSSKKHDWGTPQPFFDKLNKIFHFTLDVCASDWNAKCERYFTEEDDGLSQKWEGICWMNPPYGNAVKRWVRKAYIEWNKGHCEVVCLVPNRSETKWFQDWGFKASYFLAIRGRINFDAGLNKPGEHTSTFPSVLIIFGKLQDDQKRELSKIGVLLEKINTSSEMMRKGKGGFKGYAIADNL